MNGHQLTDYFIFGISFFFHQSVRVFYGGVCQQARVGRTAFGFFCVETHSTCWGIRPPIHACFMSPAGPLPLSTDALRLIAFRALFGIRNGALYGLKVRAPHSLVTTGALYMAFLV